MLQAVSSSYARKPMLSRTSNDIYMEKTGSGSTFMWSTSNTSDPSIQSITVFAKECPMIFSKIVGVLTLNDFDIIDVRNYRQDSNALGTFKVKALPGQFLKKEKFFKAEQDLKAVIQGKKNIKQAFRKKMSLFSKMNLKAANQAKVSVDINNDKSYLFSIIEICADDFPGILFTIADSILTSSLDIWNAKIVTQNKRISDTFYVKDLDGKKLNAEKTLAIKNKLQKALAC